jgi:hypothetical protein
LSLIFINASFPLLAFLISFFIKLLKNFLVLYWDIISFSYLNFL